MALQSYASDIKFISVFDTTVFPHASSLIFSPRAFYIFLTKLRLTLQMAIHSLTFECILCTYMFIAFLVSVSLAGLNFSHDKEHSQARIRGLDQYLKCIKNDYTRNDGDFWNNGGDIRFKHPSLLPGSLVIEVGGNSGRDSLEFLTRYKGIEYYTFEPMPNYIKTLRSKLVDTNLIPSNHILEFGVDRFDGNFSFCENGNQGEGTSAFGDPSVKCDNLVTLPVQRGSHAISQILQLSGKNEIGLLTVNCEGCEYGLFESRIEDNLFHKINIIQYSRHLLKSVPLLLPRSCRIQEHLAMHHYIKYEYPFVWESWYLKPKTVSAGQV